MDRRRPRNPPTRPLVLIVEGHEETRAFHALALSAMGFDVVAEQDGTEAFRRAWEIHPDIIATDLPMPDYDGWQFLQDLKQDARTRNIPVVAMSGDVQRSLRERAERDGFAAFFPKPCPPDELAEGLRHVLDGKGPSTRRAWMTRRNGGHGVTGTRELREAANGTDNESA
jgi:two-component system, cell cycle response regulator DivK